MKVSGHHSESTEAGFHGPIDSTLAMIGGFEGGDPVPLVTLRDAPIAPIVHPTQVKSC